MHQFPRPKPSQEQRQEDRELPIVARLEELALLVVRKGHDRPGILDQDAPDFDRTEGVFRVGWQVPVSLGIIE